MPIGQGEEQLAAAVKEFNALAEQKDFERKCGICGQQGIKQSQATGHATCWRQVPTAEEVKRPAESVANPRKRKRADDEEGEESDTQSPGQA